MAAPPTPGAGRRWPDTPTASPPVITSSTPDRGHPSRSVKDAGLVAGCRGRVGVFHVLRSRSSEEGTGPAVLLVILLVVFLGAEELRGRDDLSDDRAAEPAGGLEPRDRGLGGVALAVVVEEDHRSILVADVRPLSVQGGRVVDVPEHFEQPLVGDLRRVIFHPDDLRVSGPGGADVL